MAEEERDDYGTGYYRPPTLGELSRSLATERRELQTFDLEGRNVPPGAPGGPTQVADLSRDTGLVQATQGYISPRPPALLYQVVSTYDSRPIQGYDFQDSECSAITWGGAPPTFAPFNALRYTVPNNVIAVVRAFRYEVIDPPVNAVVEGDCWLQSDIFVNDLPVREYNKMVHPVVMEDAFPCFIIVDERLEIRLRLSVFDPANTEFAPALDGYTSPVIASFYGNIILKTGVPKEFEIANAIGGGQL
ncbi:MAG: hypothetical protein GTN49_10830 [candidate division Zixibacteria bacterium]|nr:hypothetical protein [candidate division Zixibacteria bacterium]